MSVFKILASLLPPCDVDPQDIRYDRLTTNDSEHAQNYFNQLCNKSVSEPGSWSFAHHVMMFKDCEMISHFDSMAKLRDRHKTVS